MRVNLLIVAERRRPAQLPATRADAFGANPLARGLGHTEEHVDFLETEIGLVDHVGRQNWLQSHMRESGGS